MGLFETLTGKKTFCSVCGAPVGTSPLRDAAGDPICGEACRKALERLSAVPPPGPVATEQAPPSAPAKPAPDSPQVPIDVFDFPELVVYVFRTNDPSPFYSLQERLIEMCSEPRLRVERLDGDDVSLVAVNGPVGAIQVYRRALRANLGPLAKEAKCRPEDVRPDATYTNVSESGDLRPADKAIRGVCDKIRRGVFRRVFSGPPAPPPSSAAPVLRATHDEALMDNAMALMNRHVTFHPRGVLQVESDGVREAAMLFGELARRHPHDPEPAYLEASAYLLGMRRAAADQRIESLRQRFPDHIEACLLASTGKTVFSYPSYEIGQAVPEFLRERVRGATVLMTRKGYQPQPVLFVEVDEPLPTEPAPAAQPFYVESRGVPILGVNVVFADGHRFDATVAGFEEHEGRWCLAPKACYLFHAASLPVVGLAPRSDQEPKSGLHFPVVAVDAVFALSVRDAFVRCEAAYRALHPRAFAPEQLSAALEDFRRQTGTVASA